MAEAWKTHTPVTTVVVNNAILIELASKRGGYAGGKLAMAYHPDACMSNLQIRHVTMDSRDNDGSRANSSCMWLLESAMYNLCESGIGFSRTMALSRVV